MLSPHAPSFRGFVFGPRRASHPRVENLCPTISSTPSSRTEPQDILASQPDRSSVGTEGGRTDAPRSEEVRRLKREIDGSKRRLKDRGRDDGVERGGRETEEKLRAQRNRIVGLVHEIGQLRQPTFPLHNRDESPPEASRTSRLIPSRTKKKHLIPAHLSLTNLSFGRDPPAAS